MTHVYIYIYIYMGVYSDVEYKQPELATSYGVLSQRWNTQPESFQNIDFFVCFSARLPDWPDCLGPVSVIVIVIVIVILAPSLPTQPPRSFFIWPRRTGGRRKSMTKVVCWSTTEQPPSSRFTEIANFKRQLQPKFSGPETGTRKWVTRKADRQSMLLANLGGPGKKEHWRF